ncbi:hypothetical protein GCM10028807_63110 [Spirosoma daeguense]
MDPFDKLLQEIALAILIEREAKEVFSGKYDYELDPEKEKQFLERLAKSVASNEPLR